MQKHGFRLALNTLEDLALITLQAHTSAVS